MEHVTQANGAATAKPLPVSRFVCPFQSEAGPALLASSTPGAGDVKSAGTVKFGDSVTFGMERNPAAGCCITRFMGGQSGCCPGIKDGKPFEQAYIAAIEQKIKATGEMPPLEDRVQQKLEKLHEWQRLEQLAAQTPKPTKTEPEATKKDPAKKEHALNRFFLAPFRFVRDFLKGLWEDIKAFFKGGASKPTA